ncbi:MAG TPA: hypothetical protein VG347_04865 [Verrucomicrobiae bacterium]|nr:hypothetical protein [Verrucomicrobiae bacterium]
MRHSHQEVNQKLSEKPQPEVFTVSCHVVPLNYASTGEHVKELIQAGRSGGVGRVVTN